MTEPWIARPAPELMPLVSVDDPDWQAFRADEPSWFLEAAGRAIRVFCGWHIFPQITQQADKLKIGSQGIVMLRTRHLVGVEHVEVSFGDRHCCRPVCDYEWFEAGYLQLRGYPWAGWEAPQYWLGDDGPWCVPGSPFRGLASCCFTHGFTTLPEDVKTVAYELAEQAMTVRSGNIQQVEAPGGYRASFSQNAGLTLSPEQKNRLGNYRCIGVA